MNAVTALIVTIIVGFASFRATWLWRYDYITTNLRYKFWFYFPPSDEPLEKIHSKYMKKAISVVDRDGNKRYEMLPEDASFIGELSHCHWCSSAYVTFTLGLLAIPTLGLVAKTLPIVWLAAWGLSCLLLDRARN